MKVFPHDKNKIEGRKEEEMEERERENEKYMEWSKAGKVCAGNQVNELPD